MNELKNVLSRCYEIGGRLHLSDDKLEAIKKKNSSNVAAAMKEVIVEWLKKNYDSHEPPTWKALVDAVKHPTGGNNTAEAERIASRHRAGESQTHQIISTIIMLYDNTNGMYVQSSISPLLNIQQGTLFKKCVVLITYKNKFLKSLLRTIIIEEDRKTKALGEISAM